MRRNFVTIAVLACCAMPAAHAADPLSSSYWEAAYLNAQIDYSPGPFNDKVEGFRLGARVGLAPYLNAVVDYDQRRYLNARDSFGALGLGVHTLGPVYQFFGNATWERLELDVNTNPSSDDAEDGWGVEIGGRYAMTHLELHASYKYLTLGTDINGSRYGAGAALSLSPWWALVGDYRVRQLESDATAAESEFTEWTVGFRRYFATESDRRKRKDGVLFPDDGQQ